MKIRQFAIRTVCLLGLWLGVGIQAQAQTDTVTYVYTDPQGTPLVEADASGNVIARYDYTPYGNSIASLGTAPNGPGYTGHVNDPETGLVYMQQRYYQPTGRFMSPDPVGPIPGDVYDFNRYAYASNNPIANIDPDGMDDCGSAEEGQEQTQKPCPPNPPNTAPTTKPDPKQAPLWPAVKVTATTFLTYAWEDVTVIPKWALAPPNPVVVLIGGLIYPSKMATCQEISCSTTMYSKGGKQNVRDTGLIGVSDEEIIRRLKDPSTPGIEKKRLQKEQKGRKTRNIDKRKN